MDTSDAIILAQEKPAIERLAHETHTSIAKVQQVFLREYAELSTDAHIRAFLPLLVVNRVRALLLGRRAVPDYTPVPNIELTSADISIVAKLQYVSETAKGRMI